MRKYAEFILPAIALSMWLVLAVNIYYFHSHFPLPYFISLSWDEFAYLEAIFDLHKIIERKDWYEFYHFVGPYGYGNLFWWLYGVVTYPFRDLYEQNSGSFLLYLRLISLVFETLSFISVYGILLTTGIGWKLRNFIFITVLTAPGLLLTFKPFSPDSMALFLGIQSVYLLLKNRNFLISALLFGACVGVKLNNAPTVLIYVPLFLVSISHLKSQSPEKYGLVAACGPLVILGFVSGNVTVFTNYALWVDLIFNSFNSMSSPEYFAAIAGQGMWNRILTWFYNPPFNFYGIITTGIREEFASIFLFSAIFISAVGSIITIYQLRRNGEALKVVATFIGAILATLAIVITTNRVWTWYLLTPITVVLSLWAPAIIVNPIWNRFKRATVLAIVLVLTIQLIVNLRNLREKYEQSLYDDKSQELYSQYTNCAVLLSEKNRNLKKEETLVPVFFPFFNRVSPYYIDTKNFISQVSEGTTMIIVSRKLIPEIDEKKLVSLNFKFINECHPGFAIYERN